jgi:hypothetical protein
MASEDIGLVMKYFVLRPSMKDEHGRASMKALETYEREIGVWNPRLAEDLRLWRASIRGFGNPGDEE